MAVEIDWIDIFGSHRLPEAAAPLAGECTHDCCSTLNCVMEDYPRVGRPTAEK